MIDLNKEGNRAKATAKRRELPLDNRSIEKHLQTEMIEFATADNMLDKREIKRVSNIRDEARFIMEFVKNIKDTKEAEAVDVIINTLTWLSCNNVDSEALFMIIQRANELRRD